MFSRRRSLFDFARGRLAKGPRRLKRRGDQRSIRLGVEQLEDRRLLAVRALSGFEANVLDRGDDISAFAGLDFEVNFFGTNYDQLSVSTNGYISFDPGDIIVPRGFTELVPENLGQGEGDIALADLQLPIIAPFWSDVDTTDTSTGAVTYGADTVSGRSAFGVNWSDVAYDGGPSDPTNDFQLVLIDRSDVEPLAFDLEFNYDAINWETGADSGGDIGLGGASARAGFSSPSFSVLENYELIGSSDDGAFLDANTVTGLTTNSLRSSEAGRYVFEFRSGNSLNQLGLVGQSIELAEDVIYLGEGIHPYNLPLIEQPTNIDSIDTSDADRVSPAGSYGSNLTGTGVTVGVVEARDDDSFDAAGTAAGNSGYVRTTHNDFGGRVTTPGNVPTSFGDHATHVAGTIGGNGPAVRRGFAPGVQIQSFEASGSGIGITQAQANNLDITNHSYGFNAGWGTTITETEVLAASVRNFIASDINGDGDTMDDIEIWIADRTLSSEDPRFGVYSTSDATKDTFLVSNPNLLSVWSAGNERSDAFGNEIGSGQYVSFFSGGLMGSGAGWYIVASTGNATTNAPGSDGNDGTGYDSIAFGHTTKNTVVVGAINDINDESTDLTYRAILSTNLTTGFSSYGALDDGRLGVDLVANGASLLSTGAMSNTDTATKSGTSMAAPSASGVAALVLEHYSTLGAAAGTSLPNATPTSATQKAILIHTTEDVFTVGPDYATGYGVIQADAAVQFVSSASGLSASFDRQDSVNQDTFTAGLPARTFTANLTAGQDVKATLVWTDPAGTGQQVNNFTFPNNPPNVPLDSSTAALVNDLNLRITGPTGANFLPWVLNRNAPTNAATTGVNNVDNVEQVAFVAPSSGTYTVTVGTANGNLSSGAAQSFSLLLSSAGDALEDNDSIETAAVLGSLPEVTLNDLSIHDASDIDFFKVTAHETGKLIVNAYFAHAVGDINLRIFDVAGNQIDESDTESNNEQIIIPVVGQEMYFVQVFGEDGEVNSYDLEIENFPAPVPTGVHLDPTSDTGASDHDNVTADTTPTFFIQTNVLDFVDSDKSGFFVEGTDAITALNPGTDGQFTDAVNEPFEDGQEPGIAVEVTLFNTTNAVVPPVVGFAQPVADSFPEVYRFTPTAPLADGVYFVASRTKIFDGQVPPAMGRSDASEPLWITIDTAAPAMPAPDMLASSDTGMFNNDDVTKIQQPAFTGVAEENTMVHVFGQSVDSATGLVVGPVQFIGIGRVGTDNTDGTPNNNIGRWEVTVEPLADGAYDITARFEDAAGSLSASSPALRIVVDTEAPNTPFLDLLTNDDTGRSDVDEATKNNSPRVVMTSSDPNIALAQVLQADNLKFRIFDRYENFVGQTSPEFLLYDSALDAAEDDPVVPIGMTLDMFTPNTLIQETLPTQFAANPPPNINSAILAGGVLADGVHNLKLEVEDRAGNISHDFLLEIIVDTLTPPVTFGLPDGGQIANDGLAADSDSGVTTDPTTYADRITSDTTPRLWGRAEADTVVRVFLDRDMDGVIDLDTDTFLGQTIAVPYDGNDAFPAGYWEIVSALDLNQVVGLPKDGLRSLLVTAEDVAGNPMPMNLDGDAALEIADGVDRLDIFIDTQGPQVTSVTSNALPASGGGAYDLFDPKPSVNGFSPLINSITVNLQDLPFRLDQTGTANDFLYPALDTAVASVVGNYAVVGDHVGQVAIASAVVDQAIKVSGTVTVAVNFTQFTAAGFVGAAVADRPAVGDFITFNNGANTGFLQRVAAYNAATGAITLDRSSGFAPAVGNGFSVITAASLAHAAGNDGNTTAQATVTSANDATSFFAANINAGSGIVVGDYVRFNTGAAAGTLAAPQIRRVTAFNAATGLITVNAAFLAAPVTGDGFTVIFLPNLPLSTASVTLTFATPLPDDRFTLTVSDNLVDPANNKLDGESNADQPTDNPTFPSGDGVPGSSFISRFTVDSRPEIGSFVSQNINIDTNGNFVWDPANAQIGNDATHVDLSFTLPAFSNGALIPGGLSPHDLVVAGRFTAAGATGLPNRLFDQLATYGNYNGQFRWLIDFDSDGVVYSNGDPDGVNDLIVNQLPVVGFNNIAGAVPVAGDFDRNPANGDEIGLYFAGQWALDTTHNFVLDTVFDGNMFGHPIVGDFDGNGEDDLAVFNNNQLFFDLNTAGFDGFFENANTITWGFPGVLDRPVAADMDQDGIDDIGLWVPRNSAQPNRPQAEWYFLLSNDPTGVARLPGSNVTLNHPFTPVPFGPDLYAEFGDELALPILGNFDPPVVAGGTPNEPIDQNVVETSDFDQDGDSDGADFLAWQRGYGMAGRTSMARGDGNADGSVDHNDMELWSSAFGAEILATADFNRDRSVDASDLALIMGEFGSAQVNGADFFDWQRQYGSNSETASVRGGDLATLQSQFGNGQVDGADFLDWQRQLNEPALAMLSAAAAPAPAPVADAPPAATSSELIGLSGAYIASLVPAAKVAAFEAIADVLAADYVDDTRQFSASDRIAALAGSGRVEELAVSEESPDDFDAWDLAFSEKDDLQIASLF